MSTPSKAQDPAAAALSAIEDALRLHVEPEATAAEATPGNEAKTETSPKLEFHLPTSRPEGQEPSAPSASFTPPAPRLPDVAADELGKRSRETEAPRPVLTPAVPPANDDRPSVGQILQSLQSRPDSTAMTVAIIGSAAWTGLWIGYVMFTHAAAFTGSLFSPAAAVSAFALIGPVIFFLSMGAVLRRSQEMRHTARSMAEVAIRLAEPETIATEQVVSLSQAIRREVASMGDGIDRALARASELETMVRAEVSSLERTYGENERRIRLLLNELVSEREAIIVNADRVTTALSHAQNSVASELEAATETLTGLLDQTGNRIARALDDKGGDLESRFARSGDTMMLQLETRATSLLERFQRSGEEASDAIQSRSVKIDGDLQAFANAFLEKVNARSESLSQNLEDVGARLNESIGRRADDLSGRLEGQADRLHEIVAVQGPALQDSLATLGDGLSQRLRDESARAQNLFSASGDAFAQTLTAHRDRLTDDFAVATGAAMDQMTERADALRAHVSDATHRAVEDFSQNVEAIGQTYANVSLQTVESVAGHAETLRESFAAAAGETLGAFAGHTQAFNEQFARVATQTMEGISGHTETLRETVDQTTRTTLAAIGEKTDSLYRRLEVVTGATVVALEQQTGRIEQAFRQNVDHLETTVGSTTQETLAALVGHANAFQEQFTQTAQQTIDAVSVQGERLEHMVAAATQEQLAALAGHTDSFQQNFTRVAAETTELAEARAEKMRDALEQTSLFVGETLGQSVAATQSHFETAVEETLGAFQEKSQDQIAALSEHAEFFQEHFAQTTAETLEKAEARTTSLRSSLDAIRGAVDGALSRNIATTESQFETATASAIATFQTKSQEQIDALTQHAASFQQHFALTSGASVVQVETQTRALRASLDEIRSAVDGALSGNIEATQAQFEAATAAAIEAFHSKAQEQIDALSQHADAFQQHFALTSGASILQAETQTTALRASLDEIRGAVDGALSSNIVATQAQFEAATAAAIEAFHSKAQEQIDALSQHADAFQQHFALTSGESLLQAETQTTALRASLDEIRGAVDGALTSNIVATQEQFEAATAAAIEAFHSKAQEQIDALSQHAETFQQHFALTSGDSILQAETQTTALRASLDEIRTAIDEALGQNVAATQAQFEEATFAAIEAFQAKAQQQIDALSQHAESFQQHFALTSGASVSQAETQTTALRASLDETRAAIDEALSQNVAATQTQFEAAAAAAIEAFQAKAQQQIDALSQHADSFQQNFVAATADSVGMAETRAKTLGDSLDAIRVAVDATLNRNVAATREHFETATASAIGAFEAKSQQQIDALSQHADAFERNFARTTSGAIDHAEARTEALRGSLEAIRVAVDETLSSNIAETQARFEQAAEAAINGLLAQTATIDHNFVATTSQAADSISQRVTDAHKRFAQVASEAIAAIGVHGDRVNETLAERLDAFEATMLRGGDEASNSIGYHGEMLAQQIGASLKSFETHLDDSVAHTRDRLAQHTERFNADFVGQLASLEALMRGGGESSADHIQAQTELLRDVLADNLRGFEKIVSEIGGGAAERIDAQVAALEALMRDGGASSADHIRTQTEILRETLANNLHGFERVVSELGGGASERISAQIAALENLMRDGGASSADHIRTQTEHLRDTLADNLREFEKVASEIGGGASERIGAQIAALEALMQDGGANSADYIRTQTDALRETLADNHREFERLASEVGVGASRRIGAQIAALEALIHDGGASSADQIRTQTKNLRETLAENLREFERVASELGGGASERIGAQITALETLMQDGGQHSADRIAFQTDHLRETLAENLREFEKTASELGGGASQRISAQISSLETLLRDGGQSSAAQIRTQTDYLRDTLAENLREFEKTASELGGGASQRISAQIASLETLLRDGGQSSAAQIRAQTDYLRETLAGTLREFENSVSELGGGASERISAQIASLEDLMRDGGENSIAHIRAHTDYLRDALAENLRDFEKIVAELGGGATDRINAQIASLESVVRDGGETSADRIKAQAEYLRASLADNLREFEKNVADVGGGATARIGAQAAKFVATISDRLSAIESTIDTHGADLDVRLGKRADATADLLARHIDRFEIRATDKTHEIVGVIDSLIVKAEDGLTARSRHLNDALAGRAIDIAKVLGEGGREVGRALDAKARELDQIILSRSTALTDELSAKAEEINATLGGRANEIASTLGGHIDLFERNVVGRLGQVGEEMDRRIGQIEQTVDGRGRALTDELRARAAELHDWYDSNGMKLVDLLTSRGGEVVSQIVAYAESTVGALSSRSTDIIEQLGQRQAEITGVLDRTSRDMRHSLERVTRTLDTAVAQSSAAMSQTLDDKTGQSVAALSEIHQQLKQEIGGLLDGMGQTQTSLHDLFERTESGLGRLDASLGPQIGAFAGAIEALHEELSRLDASTQDSVRHAEITARSIGGHNQVLAAGLREMEETQASLDKSLEQRLHGMEQFYEEAKKRQAEFETRLDGFSSAIGRALAQAEAKARDVGSFLTESASATAGALTGQYEELRREATRERETTSSVLTAAYEQNLGEMNQMFRQATEGYKGVSQELRSMTGEIQRELEATRKELQRGALELPRETAEQTAAMRRVVSDQIKALNELTDIVTRSGRSFDISEPTAKRQEPVRQEPVRQEPARIEAPLAPRQGWKAPTATLRREIRPEPAPGARTEQRFELRPTLPVRAPAQILAPATDKNERSGGWMSDLLARASQDEQPARRTGDPLENLSAEIARVVDETALVSAWDRYRNGDASAFSRRLYSAQGGKTFDEVRRRYQAESDFRGTVDRYLQEFERLLTEIDREDHDGSTTRTYLTSDSGKVYTLLAHAAGRLG